MRFRQKPQIVEATQWYPPHDPRHQAIKEVSEEFPEFTGPDGAFWCAYAIVRTGAEHLTLVPGDWLLKDCQGRLTVLHSDVFAVMYEPAA